MVLAAIVTFLTVSSVLSDQQARVDVVVASDELTAGSGLDAALFTTVQVHSESELVGQLATTQDLAAPGQLGRDLTAGEPLLVSDIQPVETQDAVRTIAIPVWRSAVDGLGLRVGDQVDLIGADSDGTVSFVVTNSTIARLPGSSSSSGAFSGESGRESWITVEVSDTDALALALALRAGDIEVVRSTGAPTLGVHS